MRWPIAKLHQRPGLQARSTPRATFERVVIIQLFASLRRGATEVARAAGSPAGIPLSMQVTSTPSKRSRTRPVARRKSPQLEPATSRKWSRSLVLAARTPSIRLADVVDPVGIAGSLPPPALPVFSIYKYAPE